MMADVRCKRCGRFLLESRNIEKGEIKVKCHVCKYVNKFSFPIPIRRIEQQVVATT